MNSTRKIGILLVCAMIFLLSGCQKEVSADCSINNTTLFCESKVADMSGYGVLDSNEHPFVETKMKDMINAIETNQDGIYYLSYVGCPWCQEVLPFISQAALEAGKKVMYLDMKSELLTQEDKDILIATLNEILDENEEGVKTLYVPEVVVMKNGKIEQHHSGTLEGHNATERKLTEKEEVELLNKLKDIFK